MIAVSNPIQTDVLVIGAGPGGYVAAARAAAPGKDVTLVESKALGGTCVSIGCIPSKALIAAGDLLHRLQEAGEWGIRAEQISLDTVKLQAWKDKIIKRLQQGVQLHLKSHTVQVVRGTAELTGPETAVVRGPDGLQAFRFRHCVIATGSAPAELKDLTFDHRFVINSTDALGLTEIPAALVVVGGGYIGVELGIAYRKLGARVTIVEALDQLLPGTDPDLVQVLMRRLRRLGIAVHLKARVVDASAPVREDERGALRIETVAGGVQRLPADRVLVCVGRKPYTDGLNLAAAGVQVDARGFIPSDQHCRTNVGHIFAIGDVTGNPMLAHRASKQGLVAAEVISGQSVAFHGAAVPAVVFTDPEIACVGLTEAQAKQQGRSVAVGKFPFTANGRALTHGHPDGLVKIVADPDSGLLLGVQMVGPAVTELIGEAALALATRATAGDLATVIHPHPTLSEGLMEAALALIHGKAAH